MLLINCSLTQFRILQILGKGPHKLISPPNPRADRIVGSLHDSRPLTLILGELSVVYVTVGRPLQPEPILIALVQILVPPASEVHLPPVVPDYSSVASYDEQAVCVPFDAGLINGGQLQVFNHLC